METPAPAGTATRADRRTLLIEAAAALFFERAYDEVTTTEIAKNAGVAYGLIAHHFTNKRGLYLAVLHAVADKVSRVHQIPPVSDTPAEQIREVLGRYIAFLVDSSQAYIALMRGGSGSDPEARTIIDDMRWQAGLRLLRVLGAHEPIRPVLRTATRGWIGYFDEVVLDYLQQRDLEQRDLVELAVAALVSSLRAAHAIDPDSGIAPTVVDQLVG